MLHVLIINQFILKTILDELEKTTGQSEGITFLLRN